MTLANAKWVKPNSIIDLGDRKIDVTYTPGHTVESISLYDQNSDILFTGDWFTPVLGPMFSNSSMGGFVLATENVLCIAPSTARIFSAHKYVDAGGAPEQSMGDVQQFQDGLKRIDAKTLKSRGFYPAVYEITPDIRLYSDITWLQNWTPRYPEMRPLNCRENTKTGQF